MKLSFNVLLIIVFVGLVFCPITIDESMDDRVVVAGEIDIFEILSTRYRSLDTIELSLGTQAPTFISESSKNVGFLFELNNNFNVRRIHVNNYGDSYFAFLASDFGILCFNITLPKKPQLVYTYTSSATVWDVFVEGDYLYYVSDEGFVIEDVSDIKDWNCVGYYLDSGFRRVKIFGLFAYVIDSSNNLLLVLDISAKNSPTFADSYLGTQFSSLSIDETNNLAYIGDGSFGVTVVSLPSLNFVKQLSFQGGYTNDLIVKDDILYIAGGIKGLRIFNLTNDTMITEVLFQAPGPSWDETKSLFLTDDAVYCSEASLGVWILNISNISNSELAGYYYTNGDSEGISVVGDFIFVANGKDFVTVDATDKYNIDNPNKNLHTNITGIVRGLKHCNGTGERYIFALFQNGLMIFQGTNIYLQDQKFQSFVHFNFARALHVDEKCEYAYVVDDYDGLFIIDTRIKKNPVIDSSVLASNFQFNNIFCKNDICYISNEDLGFVIFNISDSKKPVKSSEVQVSSGSNDIIVGEDSRFLYCCGYYGSGGSFINVFNITSNKTNPILIHNFSAPSFANGLFIDGDTLYVSAGDHVHVVDIKNPLSAQIVGSEYYGASFVRGIGKFPSRDVVVSTSSMIDLTIVENPSSTEKFYSYGIDPSNGGVVDVVDKSIVLVSEISANSPFEGFKVHRVIDELTINASPTPTDCGNFKIDIILQDCCFQVTDSFNITVKRKGYDLNCEFALCNNLESNDPRVCYAHGECIWPEQCVCTGNRKISSFCEDCKDYYFGYDDDCSVYLPNAPSFNVSYPKDPVGLCSEIVFSAVDLVGFSLRFEWKSPSHPELDDSFDSSPVQYIGNVSLVGEISIEVVAYDYFNRISEENITFSVSRAINDSSKNLLIQPIIVGNGFISYVNNPLFFIRGGLNLLCQIPSNQFSFFWEQQVSEDDPFLVDFGNSPKYEKRLDFINGFPKVNRSVLYTFRFFIITSSGNMSVDANVEVRLRNLEARINQSDGTIVMGKLKSFSSDQSFDPEEIPQSSLYSWTCEYSQNYSSSNISGINNWTECDSQVFSTSDDERISTLMTSKSGYFRISLLFQKDSRNNTKSIVLESVDFGNSTYIPDIEIKPLDYPINPSQPIVLQADIVKDKDSEYLKTIFEWSCPTLGANLTSLLLFSQSNINSKVLMLKPDILVNTWTKCILTATHPDVVSPVTSSINVRKNFPPKNGKCFVSPLERKVLEDFQVSFQNWDDEDFPLEYSLFYIHSISGQKKLVKPFSPSSTYRFQISTQGCKNNNYTIELTAVIRDRFRAERVYEVKQAVTVLPINYDSVVTYLEWVTYLLKNWYSSKNDVGEDISSGLSKIVQGYNFLFAMNCSNLTIQEQFCISTQECLGGVVKKESLVFRMFESSSLYFINRTLHMISIGDLESVYYILDNAQFVQNQNVSIGYEILSSFIDIIRIKLHPILTSWEIREWWERMITFYTKLIDRNLLDVSTTSSGSFFFGSFSQENRRKVISSYSALEKIMKNYLLVRFKGVRFDSNAFELQNTNNIRFDYIKEFCTSFVANPKFLITEKVISIGGTKSSSMKIPSSVRNHVSSLGDTISVVITELKFSRVLFLGLYDEYSNKIVDAQTRRTSSSSFSDPIIVTFSDISEGISCYEVSVDTSSNSHGSFQECSGYSYDENNRILTCYCHKFQSLIFLGQSQFVEEGDDDGGLDGDAVGAIIASSLLTVVLMIVSSLCCVCFLFICVLLIVLIVFCICSVFCCCGGGIGLRKTKRKGRKSSNKVSPFPPQQIKTKKKKVEEEKESLIVVSSFNQSKSKMNLKIAFKETKDEGDKDSDDSDDSTCSINSFDEEDDDIDDSDTISECSEASELSDEEGMVIFEKNGSGSDDSDFSNSPSSPTQIKDDGFDDGGE